MNELETYVESIVSDLPARHSRKERMRAEMLDHLLSLFDEEFTRTNNSSLAVSNSLRRFGPADSLAMELQESIPVWERRCIVFARRCRLQNTALRFYLNGFSKRGAIIMRYGWIVLGLFAILIGLGFVFPQIAELRMQGALVAGSIALLAMGSLMTLGGVGAVVYGVKPSRG